ncbi:MAG: BlaI/MecI/CopY family transcriptional regulator [Eubacteriales bacterium]|nr:BlaI/MecI/CopY family transcriptional regulator [Eubacteriales bacterium]
MEQETTLTNADWRLMDIVWDHEPVDSPQLCRLAEEKLGWKRTTTYTVLKRLCEKGYLENDTSVITSLVARQTAGKREGNQLVRRGFKGSLPAFIAAFLDGGGISAEEADQIEQLLQAYRERS